MLESSPVHAATRMAELDVRNMTCALCPVTVGKALQKVPGVAKVKVDFARKTAAVKYDAAQADASALAKATTNAGFPSSVRVQ